MKKVILSMTVLLLLLLTISSCSKDERNLYADLYGIVSDNATAEPIAGANVMLTPGGVTKTTGTDGRFEFNNLDPMQYTITVQKSGYQTNRKTVTAVTGEKKEANVPLTKSN